MWPECGLNTARMRLKCGPNAARMWPEYEILWPVINPWTFPVARAQPEPKPQARNPARTMKKVARPSPRFAIPWRLKGNSSTKSHKKRAQDIFWITFFCNIFWEIG